METSMIPDSRDSRPNPHAVAWLTDSKIEVWAENTALHIKGIRIPRLDAVQCVINLAHMTKRERNRVIKNILLIEESH